MAPGINPKMSETRKIFVKLHSLLSNNYNLLQNNFEFRKVLVQVLFTRCKTELEI